MYEDILVATDGSEVASRAVDHAVGLANGIDDTVYVLSVANPSESPMAFGAETVAEIETATDRTVEELDEHLGEGDLRGAVRRGQPAEQICSFATEQDVDAIVLGRSSSGLAERLLGSTADRVAREASRPVVLVPAEA